MKEKILSAELKKMNSSVSAFLSACEKEILDFLNQDVQSAEEGLQREILLEFMEHVYGIRHIVEYSKKTVVEEGTLSRNPNGDIFFRDRELGLLEELEVLVYNEEYQCDMWTRAFVGGSGRKYLVGLDRDAELYGMRARIRA